MYNRNMTESLTLIPFEERLRSNSRLEISPREAVVMKQKLEAVGANMDIGMDAEDALLFLHKFQNLDEERGKGVCAILGREKSEKLLEWCVQKGLEGGSGRIGKKDGTEGRGLIQAAADILAIAYFSDKKEGRLVLEKKVQKLNQRVRKGLERKYKGDPTTLMIIEKKFSSVPKPRDPGMLASIPEESLPELWHFLSSNN